MKPPLLFRPLLLASLWFAQAASAADAVKTWLGTAPANPNALNNAANWDGGTRPTFGAAANTDALLFTGGGSGTVGVNVDATAKSLTLSGPLAYAFQGASPLRLGDATTASVQPNTGFIVNQAEPAPNAQGVTPRVSLTTTGGLWFRFGGLDAAANGFVIGASTPVDIGNGAATAGRNVVVKGAHDVTVNGYLTGLGTQATEGGHLIKQGSGTLFLLGNSDAWAGRVFIEAGAVRINRAASLGSAGGDTSLLGGDSAARLELTGNLLLAEPLVIGGRSSPAAAALVNVSGNNILSAPVSLAAGGEAYALEATAGLLSLEGGLDYGTAIGAATLHLRGAGRGSVPGIIGAGGDPLGIVKTDPGSWALTGANAFTGPVQVAAGRLDLTTRHAASNEVTVAAGATLGVTVAAGGQTLATSALHLAGTAGTALELDLGPWGNPAVPVLSAPVFTVTGTVGLALKAGALAVGQIPLIEYEGAIGGDGFAGLVLSRLPARVQAALVDDAANSRVLLNVTGIDRPRWSGELGGDWDVDDGTGSGTANWREVISGAATRYLQGEAGADAVLFDDLAVGTANVQLAADLSPAAILVDNTAKDYAFGGNGRLVGDGSLIKRGGGTLTLRNGAANTYSGLTTIEAGTLVVGDGLTPAAGSLGTGPVRNDGVLILNRPDAYTLAGALSGSGSFVKRGAGTTTLSGNSSFTGAVEVLEGTLKLGSATALGSDAAGVFVAAGAALDLGGQLLPAGEAVTVTGFGVAGSGAVVNTGAGGFAVGLKRLIVTGPASLGGNARWDIRDQPGGVNVNGHPLTKTGTNVVHWAHLGETHLGELAITGAGSRLTFEGDTTLGDRPGRVRVEPGAQLGLEHSTVRHAKPILIEAGTLNATGGTGNVVAGSLTLTTAATVNVAAGAELLISGRIRGDGSLTKTTGGTLKITGDANTYTGATTIAAGPLWLGNDTPTGSLPPQDIVNNGNLVVRRTGAPFTLAQNISGTGQLTVGNAGTGGSDFQVTLAGQNSFTGNVTVNRGFLRIPHAAALGQPAAGKTVAVASAARPTLVLDGRAGAIVLDPLIEFTLSSDGVQGAILNEAGANVIQGPVHLNNGGGGNARIRVSGGSLSLNGLVQPAITATSNRVLLLDGDGAGGAVNGVLADNFDAGSVRRTLAVTKAGSGTWRLTHSANTYTGATTVTAGTLQLGAAASVASSPVLEVQAGAVLDVSEVAGFSLAGAQVLRGAGRVTGQVTLPAGTTLVPGANTTAGTLAIQGSLHLAGGRVLVNFDGPAGGADLNDLVEITGDLDLAAASTIEIAATGKPLSGTYRLFNYGGALIGDAGSLTLVNPNRASAVLDTSTPGQVNLVVSGGAADLVWSGNGSTNVWDILSPASWNAGAERFYPSDAVLFDDSSANTAVTLTGTLQPSAVRVDSAQDYSFSGSGSIAGSTGLTKAGAGTLTLNNVNGYTGKTRVAQGTLKLGASGRLNGTRWIEVDAGATLDVQAIGAGFVLGSIAEPRVLSGRGQILGKVTVNSAGVIRPGAASGPDDVQTAGDGLGALHFGGDLTLAGAAAAGSPRAVLRLAAPTGSVADPLDTAAVAALAGAAPGAHDFLRVAGTLALDAGSTLRLELAEGYVPELGDVFNLADWGALNLNADGAANAGFDPQLAADLELPDLPAGRYWNRSLFAAHGLLFISTAPPTVGALEVSPASTVNPGVPVTFSAAVSGPEPFSYQWRKDNADIPGATGPTLVLAAAAAADQGGYSLVVRNAVGATATETVHLQVNEPVVIAAAPLGVTADPGQTARFEVTAFGTGPLSYQWRKNGAPIDGATGDLFSLADVTEADQAAYDVVVGNVTGSVISAPALLQVNDPVSIVEPPQAQGGLEGGSVSFSVTAAGTGPFSYQWFKDGVALPGETQAVLLLEGLTQAAEGQYTVQVGNALNQVTSLPAALVIGGETPKVVAATAPQLLAAGQPLRLEVQAVGAPAPACQWYRGTTKLTGATSPVLQLASARLADGGDYRVDITSVGTVSQTIPVGIVDAAPRRLPAAVTTTARLEVKVAGTGLAFAWVKDSVALADGGRVAGAAAAVLTVSALEAGDSGLYRLVVSGPGGATLTTQGHALQVFSAAPVITENPPNFGPAILGGPFSYTIPVDPDPARTPGTFSAKGLPPGLQLDALTGVITGRPTAVSKDPLGYPVTLTAANAVGSAVVSGRLLVQSIPAGALGAFAGPVSRSAPLNDGLGGRLDLLTTAKGSFSGKLALGAATLGFKGLLETRALQPARVQGTAVIARKGRASLTLSFTLDADLQRLVDGQLSDGQASLDLEAWRNPWNAKTQPAPGGYQTFVLDAVEPPPGAAVPQGHGFGAFTVAPAGTLKIAGKLSDGDPLTGSSFVGPQGEIVVFAVTKSKGSVLGRLDLDTPDLTGALSWSRPASSSPKQRLYRDGFPAVLNLAARGGRYTPPTAPRVFLGLEAGADVATLSLRAGGLEAAVADPADLDLPVALAAKGKASLPANLQVNPRQPKLALTEKTGLIKGGFSLETPNPVATGKPVKTPVTFEGITIREGEVERSYGFFLLPQPPSAEQPVNTPILSGRVVLQPAGAP